MNQTYFLVNLGFHLFLSRDELLWFLADFWVFLPSFYPFQSSKYTSTVVLFIFVKSYSH